MGGRFGKYGDAKRKAQIKKNRLQSPDPRRPLKGKRSTESPKKKGRK